jgi:PII-like signaling protein
MGGSQKNKTIHAPSIKQARRRKGIILATLYSGISPEHPEQDVKLLHTGSVEQRSARHPVTVEVVGSNPIRIAVPLG